MDGPQDTTKHTHETVTIDEEMLQQKEKTLGADHPETLAARGDVAYTYWSNGRIAEAIEIEEAVLADCERVFGAEDPATLVARSNLASSYWSEGRTGTRP